MVVSTEKDLARVRVDCLSGCRDCAAHSLCLGEKNKSGILSVRNSVGAHQGDRVVLSVPDGDYSRSLSIIFGSLLLAVLGGGGAGYALGPLFSLAPAASGALGLFFVVILTGWGLSRYFRRTNNTTLYPVITEIIQKEIFDG